MNNKALYWIALGVFALGLNNEYQKGNLTIAHRVAARAQAVYCQVAVRAEQTLALARVLSGRQDFTVNDQFLARQQAEVDRVLAEHQAELDRAMALRHVDLDRVQAQLDRMHAAMARAQAVRVRVERPRFKFAAATNRRFIVCPQTGARVTLDAEPDVADLNVEVEDAQ